MNSTSRACLFGGTLLAAGISNPALGQEFVIGDSVNGAFFPLPGANAYVYSYADGTIDSLTGPATGPQSVSASIGTASASIELGSNALVASTTRGGDGFFTAFDTTTQFTLSETATVDLEWAVDEDLTTISRQFQILDASGAVIFDYLTTATPGAGTASITLDGDTGYQFFASGATFDTEGQSNLFFSATVVPAPGAAALLGLGGLAAIRRRRS